MIRNLITLGALLGLIAAAHAAAPTLLPYAERTHPFNGLASTVRGDIRTVGMAGATVGLGDTFIASIDNPAGLAMTMNTGDFNAASNWVRDSRVQDWDNPMYGSNFGVAVTPYPWGISLGYYTPYSEGQEYLLPGYSSAPEFVGIEIREYRLSLARNFFRNRVALGLSLGLGHATSRIAEFTTTDTSFRPTLGAMIQLPKRLLLGLSYSFPTLYDSHPTHDSGSVSNFFQPIHVPGRFALGVGWIPNRFFRCDASLFIFGSTSGTTLVGSDTRAIGRATTLQPRAGISYDFVEFRNFRATAFGGGYYEPMRIGTYSDRLHVTAGIEVKPWILTLGTGVDYSPGYRNFLVSTGIDLIKTLQKAELVPTPRPLPYGGFLPEVKSLSNVGLARPISGKWRPKGGDIDPIQAGIAIPSKLKDKVEDAGEDIIDFFDYNFSTDH